MVAPSVRLLEMLVMMFQVLGVAALCLSRLMSATRWADRAKTGYVVALFGLGLAGALCGRYDSEFALFAGGTLTALLIGMTMGSGASPTAEPEVIALPTEAKLAA